MKFINKLFLLALIVGFTACDAELDLQVDPNAVTPEKASVKDLYNNIQLEFASAFRRAENIGGQLTRMYNMGSFTYESHTSPTSFNGLWFSAYSGLFPDMEALLAITEPRGLDIHTGSVKIMKAYVLMALVDNLNNVPLTEAGKGTDIISPKADDGASVYAAANTLLDEAITLLGATSASAPNNDFYYGGDAAKWVTLAKTLKLRAALTTRLIDPSGATSTINSIVSGGDFIDDEAEDFVVQFGSKRNNPNSRHWMYNNHYEAGDGDYLSNYYMWLLRSEKVDADDNPIKDPRLRYYFYRQTEKTNELDPTVYSCHFSTLPTNHSNGIPTHYESVDPRMPYCTVTNDGYFGRDHGNGEGIPPDGPFRTHYGLYPGGGQFDDNSFIDTRLAGTTGGLGEGIFPIVLSSFVDFMRAEAALTIGTNDDAKALLESGMRKSIAKVMSFKKLVPTTFSREVEDRTEKTTVEARYEPKAEDIDAYVNHVLAEYDAADANGKLNVVMTEYFIALWGNGLDAYNMYRRTGMPNNMQPTIEPAGGTFSRSFFLPAVHVNRNANATQKELTEKVFWDDGSATIY
jgi:hypothetical protein